MSIFTVTELATAIKAGKLKFEVEKPKKEEANVVRLNFFLNDGVRRQPAEFMSKVGKPGKFKLAGTVSNPNDPEDLMVKSGFVNTSTESKDNKLTISTKVSLMDDDLVLVLDFLHNGWLAAAEQAIKEGYFTIGEIGSFRKDTYSKKSFIEKEKRGKKRDEATYNMRIDFNKYSPKYYKPELRGQQISQIQDYSKSKLTPKGITFETATDESGQSLNKFNSYKFLTQGSEVVAARYSFTNGTRSQLGISAPVVINLAIVKKAVASGYDDSMVDNEELPEDLNEQFTSKATVSAPPNPQSTDNTGGDLDL